MNPLLLSLGLGALGTAVGTAAATRLKNYQLPNGGGSYSGNGNFANSTASLPFQQKPFNATIPAAVPTQTAPNSPIVPEETPGTTAYQAPSFDEGVNFDDVASKLNSISGYSQTAPTSGPTSSFDKYMALKNQQASDMLNNTGAYYIDPKMAYSPSQVQQIQNSGNDLFQAKLTQIGRDVKAESEKNNTFDMSALRESPYLQGLKLNGLLGGASKQEREDNYSYFASLPLDAQKSQAKSAVYNRLSVGERDRYQQGDNAQAVASSLINNLPPDFYTNFYKYQKEKFSSYLGLEGDQRYRDFSAKIGLMSAPIINNIYGAAVTGAELDRANQFIPNLANDSTGTVLTKLKNLEAFYEFGSDAIVANKLGIPRPNLDEYLQKNDATASYKPSTSTAKQSGTGGLKTDW